MLHRASPPNRYPLLSLTPTFDSILSALEHPEHGIQGYVTEATTLLVLKKRQAEAFVLSLVDA
jgi:hypothetical protein